MKHQENKKPGIVPIAKLPAKARRAIEQRMARQSERDKQRTAKREIAMRLAAFERAVEEGPDVIDGQPAR